jgi:hypothetical protein
VCGGKVGQWAPRPSPPQLKATAKEARRVGLGGVYQKGWGELRLKAEGPGQGPKGLSRPERKGVVWLEGARGPIGPAGPLKDDKEVQGEEVALTHPIMGPSRQLYFEY